jgi:WD40 repeat protein
MARFSRNQTRAMKAFWRSFQVLALSILLIAATAKAEDLDYFYDYPTLIADPGVHTSVIRSSAVDKSGNLIATGSEDKTVRVWSLANHRLRQTIHIPSGPGWVGQVFSIAMSARRNRRLVAVGGWAGGA